jgi:hypothetical protein
MEDLRREESLKEVNFEEIQQASTIPEFSLPLRGVAGLIVLGVTDESRGGHRSALAKVSPRWPRRFNCS